MRLIIKNKAFKYFLAIFLALMNQKKIQKCYLRKPLHSQLMRIQHSALKPILTFLQIQNIMKLQNSKRRDLRMKFKILQNNRITHANKSRVSLFLVLKIKLKKFAMRHCLDTFHQQEYRIRSQKYTCPKIPQMNPVMKMMSQDLQPNSLNNKMKTNRNSA